MNDKYFLEQWINCRLIGLKKKDYIKAWRQLGKVHLVSQMKNINGKIVTE